MPDLTALREAEALVSLADELAARIAAELRALEQACRLARESLARVGATAAKSVEHLRRLGEEERRGRELQAETVAELASGERLRSALAGEGLPSALLEPPALATVSHLPAQPFRPPAVALPRFAVPRREELAQESLPASTRQAGWDLLAAEVRTFKDRYEEGQARLDAAEEEARKERRRRPARKPASPDRERKSP